MAIDRKKRTPKQIALDESENSEQYFLKVLEAKKEGEPWAKDIPLDKNVVLAHMYKIHHLRGPFKKDAKPLRSKIEVLREISKRTKKV